MKQRRLLSLVTLVIMLVTTIVPPTGGITFGAAALDDLLISEYIEGSSNNKAIELYNGTGKTVDLSAYTVELYSNGATEAKNTVDLSGTLESGDVFVIGNSSASSEISDVSDITSSVTYFNGDDALVLKHNGTVIDSFGKVGEDPGSNWGGVTSNKTLVRKSTVIEGDTVIDDTFDPSTEWDVYDQDTFSYLGSHDVKTADWSTIESARKAQSGDTVTVRGTLTSDGSTVFMQDATAGINLYKGSISGMRVGDYIEVNGTMAEYNGLKEIKEYTATKIYDSTSPGAIVVTPAAITVKDIGEDYESELISLSDVRLSTLNTKGTSYFSDPMGQKIGSYKMDVPAGIEENDLVNVTAIVSEYNGYQLYIRDKAELTSSSAIYISIDDARALGTDKSATVRGVITAKGDKTFIQDATGGLNLYGQDDTTTFSVGDLVELSGKTGAYNGLMQINDYGVKVIESGYGQVTPEKVTLDMINTSLSEYESEYVQIDNVQIGAINPSGSTSLTDDASHTVSIYKIPSLTGISEGDKVSVKGFVTQYKGTPQIHVESASDVSLYTGYDTEALSAVREKALESTVTVLGTVVHRESGTLIYVQDSTAGIKVDTYGMDVDLSGYNPGDVLVITGKLESYKSELEISVENTSDIVTVSTGGTVPTPVPITVSQLADYQGQLVVLKQVKATAAADTYNIPVEDSTGSCNVYHAKAENFDSTSISAGDYYDVIGVAATYSTPQLKLRNGSDITEVDGPVNSDALLPLIFNNEPAHLSETFDKKPVVSAHIEKTVAELNTESIKMKIDDKVVSHTYADGVVSFAVTEALSEGEHKVEVEVADVNGDKGSETWYFLVGDENADYNFYYGIPHSHTSYSDGKLTPADAFEHAKNTGLDFLIVTDHSNWLDGVKSDNYEYDEDRNEYVEKEGSEWYKTRKEAEAFNKENNDFLAVRGFEMTFSSIGHSNMINSDTYVEAKSQMTSLSDYYDWVNEQGDDTVAAFNHPNWPSDSFNNLAYVPEMDRMMSIIEVGNGAPPYSYSRSEEWYIRALDNGWRLGAVNAQDNHSDNWGDPDNLTVVLAEDLTTDSFVEAIRERHTYSTETRTLELMFTGNGHVMGSLLNVEQGDTIDFKVNASDSEVKIKELQLITNGGIELESYTPDTPKNNVTWSVSETVQGGSEWYYVKVIHEDGSWGISSPIFTPESESNVKVASLKFDPESTLENMETDINVTLSNTGVRDASDLEVKVYKNSVSSSNLIDTKTLSELKAGKSKTLTFSWTPDVSGDVKIIAKLKGIEGMTTVTELSNTLKVVAANGKTVMIDDAHDNADVIGSIGSFISLIQGYGYNVKINEKPITADILSDVDVLVLNLPSGSSKNYSDEEEQAIADWVKAGGGIMLASKSNYGSESTLTNSLLEEMESGIRFNDDNVYETEDSSFYTGGMVWSVYSYNLPEMPSGLNDNMEAVRIFSGCSLTDENGDALVNDADSGLEIVVGGNASSYNASPGENAHVYNEMGDTKGETIPIIAKEDIGSGRLVAAGRHFYSDYEIVNDVSNTALTLRLIDYLSGYDRIQTIKSARQEAQEGDVVTVKGVVTVPSETFYDVIYIQDETSGVCLYGSYQDKKQLKTGDVVIATGTVKYFEGELELGYDDFDTEILYVGPATEKETTVVSTKDAMSSDYTGMLVETKGNIVEMHSSDSYFVINDGSGLANIHVDGYVGADITGLEVGDGVLVKGIASMGSIGHRIRVRGAEDLKQIDPLDISGGDSGGSSSSSHKHSSSKKDSSTTTNTDTKTDPNVARQEVKTTDKATVKVSQMKDGRKVVEVKVDTQAVISDMQNSDKRLKISAISEEGATDSKVSIASDVFAQANLYKKDLTVEMAQASITIPPKALSFVTGQEVSVKADVVSGEEASAIFDKIVETGVTPVSGIMELDIVNQSGDSETKVALNGTVDVELEYDADKISDPRKAGIYYFNETDNNWEYVGGYVTADGKIKAAVHHFSKYAVLESDKTFADIQGHWAQDAVEIMTAKHIVSGVSETSFDPSREVSRAEFVTMLIHAIDLEAMDIDVPMADVNEDAWYYSYMKTAAQYGLIQKTEGAYNPNEKITREEMALILSKSSKLTDFEMTRSGESCGFTDIEALSDETVTAIDSVYQMGLMSGLSEDTFAPNGKTRRCEAAMVIYKLMEQAQKSVLLEELAQKE